jgi:hypothetical protein
MALAAQQPRTPTFSCEYRSPLFFLSMAAEGGGGGGEEVMLRGSSLEDLCVAAIAENPDVAMEHVPDSMRLSEPLVQSLCQIACDSGTMSDELLEKLLGQAGAVCALQMDGVGEEVTERGLRTLLEHVERVGLCHADIGLRSGAVGHVKWEREGDGEVECVGVTRSLEVERTRGDVAVSVALLCLASCAKLEHLALRKCSLTHKHLHLLHSALLTSPSALPACDFSLNADLDASDLFPSTSAPLGLTTLILAGCRGTNNTSIPSLPLTLRHLSLAHTSISSLVHFSHIARLPLTTLDLSGLSLGNALLDALAPLADTLEVLRIPFNRISTLVPLFEHRLLQELDVAHNPDLEHAEILRAAAALPSLTTLHAIDTGWDASRPQPDLVTVLLTEPRRWQVM